MTPQTADDAPPRALSPNAEGALWMLGSVAGATAMTVAVRILTPDLHTAMLAFLRSALALALVLPFLWRSHRSMRRGSARGRLSFKAWPAHLLRGGLIAFALNAGFYAIWQLPMATATILFFMAPIYATILAQLVLGERVGPRRWSAIAMGFLGALVILRPGLEPLSLGMLAALASSLAFAGSLVVGRIASRRDSPDSVFVSSSVLVAVLTLAPAIPYWEIPTALWMWAAIALLVAGSSLRTYADIRAVDAGDLGFVAPFSYLRLLTVGLAGYVWFGETIGWATVAGGAVIIGSTLYISIREARLKARTPRAAAPEA